jgi:hypothetical protein
MGIALDGREPAGGSRACSTTTSTRSRRGLRFSKEGRRAPARTWLAEEGYLAVPPALEPRDGRVPRGTAERCGYERVSRSARAQPPCGLHVLPAL